jgi:signal transduction histidine kinase
LEPWTEVERLRLVAEIGRAFAEATLSPAELPRIVVERFAATLRCIAILSFVSSDGSRLEVQAIHDLDPAFLAEYKSLLVTSPPLLDENNPSTYVVRSGKYLLIPQIPPGMLEARVRPADRERARALGVTSILLVPLRSQGRTIGTIGILRHGDPTPLDEQDAELAQMLGDQAALALANAQHLAERTRVAARQKVLADIGRELSEATDDYPALLALITRRLGENVGEFCIVRIVSDDGNWIVDTGTAWHPDPQLAAVFRAMEAGRSQRTTEGASAHALATGEPVVIANVDAKALLDVVEPHRRELLAKLRVACALTVPLMNEGKAIGIISLTRSDPTHPYTPDEVELVRGVASHAALAIANARLLQSLQAELRERAEAERALRRTEEQLRESQKLDAVGRLAGGIAHDFNNLLSIVLSYSALILADLPEDSPLRPDVEEIAKAGKRAAGLTQQLLAYSRRQLVEPKILDLNEIVRSMERMIRRMIGEDIELVTQLDPELGPVKVDRNQIEQVILNLVVNASHAMPKGGHLQITTANVPDDPNRNLDDSMAQVGPRVSLSVVDDGVGMDAATKARIFEPFFTTKATGEGTGLGLSTVFGIVKQHGGSIRVASELGQGASFVIQLPRCLEEEEQPAPRKPPKSVRGGETILLVEDEDALRAVARTVLSMHGYRVLDASSGPEAITKAQSFPEPIDLLLTDVVMPKMGGRELAQRMVAARPSIRVLYMSGYDDGKMSHHGVLDAGIDLLQKPITPDRLLIRVRSALDGAPGE